MFRKQSEDQKARIARLAEQDRANKVFIVQVCWLTLSSRLGSRSITLFSCGNPDNESIENITFNRHAKLY